MEAGRLGDGRDELISGVIKARTEDLTLGTA